VRATIFRSHLLRPFLFVVFSVYKGCLRLMSLCPFSRACGKCSEQSVKHGVVLFLALFFERLFLLNAYHFRRFADFPLVKILFVFHLYSQCLSIAFIGHATGFFLTTRIACFSPTSLPLSPVVRLIFLLSLEEYSVGFLSFSLLAQTFFFILTAFSSFFVAFSIRLCRCSTADSAPSMSRPPPPLKA